MRRTRHTRSDTARRSPRADEPAGAEEVVGDGIGRPRRRGIDRSQQFDRGGDPRGGCHASARAGREVRQFGDSAAQPVFVRLPGPVDPEHPEAERQCAERIPWIGREEADRIRAARRTVRHEPIDPRIRLEHAHRLHAEHVVQQLRDPGRPHRIRQHARLAIGQDRPRHAPLAQRRQQRRHLGIGVQHADTPPARRRAAQHRRCHAAARRSASASRVSVQKSR